MASSSRPAPFKTAPRLLYGCGAHGLDVDGPAQGGDGKVDLPLLPEGVAEVVVRFRQVVLECDGAAVGGDGLVGPARLLKRETELEVEHRRLGPPAGLLMPQGDLHRLLDRERSHEVIR